MSQNDRRVEAVARAMADALSRQNRQFNQYDAGPAQISTVSGFGGSAELEATTDHCGKIDLVELARAALAAADAVGAEDGWSPIETAPKGPGRFLAAHKASGVIAITWHGKTSHVPLYGWCHGEDPEDIDLWQPTHWRPLPPAPSPEGET